MLHCRSWNISGEREVVDDLEFLYNLLSIQNRNRMENFMNRHLVIIESLVGLRG